MKKIIFLLFLIKVNLILRKKIFKIAKNISGKKNDFTLNKDLLNKHRKYLSSYGFKRINQSWIKSYIAVSKNRVIEYIPENIYYCHIESKLNDYSMCRAYSNKNFYQRYLTDFKDILPEVYLRRENGVYYSGDYEIIDVSKNYIAHLLKMSSKFIVKPSLDSGGGQGVTLVDLKGKDNDVPMLIEMLNDFGSDFVLQPFYHQHEFYNQFNETSVNTLRIFTYRSVFNNHVEVLHVLLRIGRKGSHVDNQAAGGVACGIDKGNGKLNTFVSDKYGNKTSHFNGVNFINEIYLPDYQKILSISNKIALKYPYHRLLSFDFFYDQNMNPKLIEINTKNHEINFYQFNNGPLFGKYTDEILAYCKNQKHNFILDYSI